MPSRIVPCIAKIKETLLAVSEIPADSRTVYEVIQVDTGIAGIYLELGANADFAGHAMSGGQPSQGVMNIPFAVYVPADALDRDAPATGSIVIAEAIRAAFETRQLAGEFRGLASIVVSSWGCWVDDEWPVISGSIQVTGFF